jgi:hypothetical protein
MVSSSWTHLSLGGREPRLMNDLRARREPALQSCCKSTADDPRRQMLGHTLPCADAAVGAETHGRRAP